MMMMMMMTMMIIINYEVKFNIPSLISTRIVGKLKLIFENLKLNETRRHP